MQSSKLSSSSPGKSFSKILQKSLLEKQEKKLNKRNQLLDTLLKASSPERSVQGEEEAEKMSKLGLTEE